MEKRRKFRLHDGRSGAALTVHTSLSASTCALTGITKDGVIQVKVVAADQSTANRELTVYLAKLLKHPQSQIEILAGAEKPEKLVAVLGMDSETVQTRLLKAGRK